MFDGPWVGCPAVAVYIQSVCVLCQISQIQRTSKQPGEEMQAAPVPCQQIAQQNVPLKVGVPNTCYELMHTSPAS